MDKQTHSEVIKRRFERDAAAFNAIYDCKNSEFSGWFNRAFRKPIFERFDVTFEKMGDLNNKTVLDVGCGSGVYSAQCAVNGAKKVKGIDFSAPMLEIARQRGEAQGVKGVCEFELKDFLKMEVQEKYNFAIAMGVFDYLPDPLTFLQKLKAATSERILISFPGHSLIREPLRKLRYFFTSKGRVFFYSLKDIEKLVANMQFRHVEIRPLKTGSGYVLIADI